MQKLLIAVLTATTTCLAIVCYLQSRELRTALTSAARAEEARVAEADSREAHALRVKELERSNAQLEKQVQEFTAVTAALRSNESRQATSVAALAQQVRAARTNVVTAEEKPGALGKGMGEMLAKMMKDPAMREMMRDQQAAVVKMMYAGLFKELNLTPDEKDKLVQLLTDAQMKHVEGAQAMFGGTDAAAPEKSFADSKKETDAQIKALLGDQRFAQFQDYQNNMGERMQLDQIKNSLAGQHVPLSDQQSSQILQIMKEEKAVAPPAIPSDANQDPGKVKALMTAENIEKQLRWTEDYNARVLARAQQVLTPEQFKQFQAFQEQQASMQKLGLKMAREMFSAGEKGGAPAPSN